MQSENSNFRYVCNFRYDSEIHCAKRKCCPFFYDTNDPVLCNSHFSLNVIILFWYFWYFTSFVRLYKPPYGQIVTLTFANFHFTQLFLFGPSFVSFLSSFSHFLSCQTHPFEDDNSKDVWLSLKTLKRRVARLVNGGLHMFLYFK